MGSDERRNAALLIRVDEFPHASACEEPARFGVDAFRRFHEVMADAGATDGRARIFVPPVNRFSRSQYPILASRYEIVCGGPESVVEMGFQATPQWRGDAIYLPSDAPLYGRASEIRPAVERLIEREAAIWVPIVLRWGCELDDDLAELTRLAKLAAPIARPWDELLQPPD